MHYLNPDLDHDALGQAMRQRGRVLIRNFFAPPVAEAMRAALADLDWTLCFRDARGDQRLGPADLAGLGPDGRRRLTEGIHALAAREFQFSFFNHALVDDAERGDDTLLVRMLRWMAEPEFMATIGALGDAPDVRRLYAQATMYARGNFLMAHDDQVPVERRRLAYVLNLTPMWRPDWGGLLHFSDDEGNVVDTFYPHFNSLSLFKVPQTHFVSYVAPYAQSERYAITGWFVAD